MGWKDKLLIIGSLLIAIAWIESRHQQEIDRMDERWKWLFDWAHQEIDELKGNQATQKKS